MIYITKNIFTIVIKRNHTRDERTDHIDYNSFAVLALDRDEETVLILHPSNVKKKLKILSVRVIGPQCRLSPTCKTILQSDFPRCQFITKGLIVV